MFIVLYHKSFDFYNFSHNIFSFIPDFGRLSLLLLVPVSLAEPLPIFLILQKMNFCFHWPSWLFFSCFIHFHLTLHCFILYICFVWISRIMSTPSVCARILCMCAGFYQSPLLFFLPSFHCEIPGYPVGLTFSPTGSQPHTWPSFPYSWATNIFTLYGKA